ncbi:MAG TPA: hypothetical protein VHY91_02300 [Pirellulales bacterium]|nr:hypothetical protein [Pirellulales bacterium]
MPLRAILIATIVTVGVGLSPLGAKDWIFDDGPFTVDPKTGKRVDQYQKKAVPTAVPYDQYFSPNGAGAYIPFGYYEENLGIGFGYGGYGGYGGGGYGYGGYGFGSAYPAFGGYAF